MCSFSETYKTAFSKHKMIAKIQLKLNNDVLLTVIKMVQQTDDYAVNNITDALLISTKEDLINKLEDKAKNIHKQVSILDHNKKHSLVLKYHEAYSLYKLLDAVFEKQLFNDSPHIKRIKRLISELHNKVDIFAKEEDFAIVDVENNDEVVNTANLVETELFVNETNHPQVEITLEQAAFESLPNETGITDETHLNLFNEVPKQEEQAPLVTDTPISEEIKEDILPQEESTSDKETIIWEESLEKDTSLIRTKAQKDLFSVESKPDNTIAKVDWEIIKAEDEILSDTPPSSATLEKQSLNDSKYSEFFNIAKKGINAEENDLANKKEDVTPTQVEATIFDESVMNAIIVNDSVANIPPTDEEHNTEEIEGNKETKVKDVMQIEIFDVETIVTEPIENKPKRERKREKKNSSTDQEGQISLF